MAIVIIRQDGKIDLWKEALLTEAPDLDVYSYYENHPKDDIEVALVWKHPEGSLAKYNNLELIACNGAGVDFIFEDPDVPEGIPITRVVDTKLAEDMSEHVLAVILAHLKNLDIYKLQQTQKVWKTRDYHRISDFKVGIMGLGELGSVLAKDLVRFGFEVQGWSNSPKSLENVNSFAGDDELSGFLASTEILVCLLPLTDKTTGILNKSLFKKLPKNAFVINVARGGHLVDLDLIEMLDNDHLSGAGLDVYHQEPLPTSHPFWQHEKIHMTPHYASVSDPKFVVPQIVENYRRLKAGKSLLNEVSRDKGY
ncbi:glyoxylate/hydroxypyruvate reductase A [Pricia sp. S334]|uniref:Glyoxylate/hydroxypyruvate reductase A n=1 Tax=Pricia mediterranea TaxID=3076079 RepID=A0ABU3LA20_9FLAO|nr:glyoxylate/hydroxypyruvate reductase A [Pricia sp. S334]MDT7830585.1 glyoxylate/hydroxypyruvate reductase A [Pricia sp. S334]